MKKASLEFMQCVTEFKAAPDLARRAAIENSVDYAITCARLNSRKGHTFVEVQVQAYIADNVSVALVNKGFRVVALVASQFEMRTLHIAGWVDVA